MYSNFSPKIIFVLLSFLIYIAFIQINILQVWLCDTSQ